MSAGLSRDTIYLGTQTLLVVNVLNPSDNAWPVIAPVEGLRIRPYGSPSAVRDLLSRSVRRTYRFVIDPSRAGEFTIPSVSLGSGADALSQGPFTLHVVEAEFRFLSASIEPSQVCPSEKATISVAYQGIRPGQSLVVPAVKGLTLRASDPPQIRTMEPREIPVSIFEVEVAAAAIGTYEIKGISLDGVTADAVTLHVQSFVVVGTQAGESSLAVGEQTLVHVVIRGLGRSAEVKLAAPAGVKIEPAAQQYNGPPGTTVFSFNVTAVEPGAPSIAALELAGGRRFPLPKPITLSVRQAGDGGILAVRGAARTAESIVGESFIVDYEVFLRGELRAFEINLDEAPFANKPYITVEPVNDLTYEGWNGSPLQIRLGEEDRATVLYGSGELNGQKEQLLRFALKITPMAAGDLELKGVRAVVQLVVKKQQTGPGMFFQSVETPTFVRAIEVPAHRVIDPPGKRQPPGYRGAVGRAFAYVTELDRTTATAMAPLTLTMKISGEGLGAQFKPPPLAELPEVARDFDVSPNIGGGEVKGDTITFTRTIRPRNEQVEELPSLPLVYYNYVKKEYETVYSLPIALSVAPGSLVGATAMQTPSGGSASTAPAGPAGEGRARIDLGANHATIGALHAKPLLGPIGVVGVLLAGPCAVAAVWAGRRWRQRLQPLAAARRRRKELLDGLDQLSGREDFHAALAERVQACLRLAFGLPPGEVSAGTLARAMAERKIEPVLRAEIESLLLRCDTGRFAAARADGSERSMLIAQARNLFERLDRS